MREASKSLLQLATIIYLVSCGMSAGIAADSSNLLNSKPLGLMDYAVPGELLIKYKQPVPQARAKARATKHKARRKSLGRKLGIEHWVLDKSQNTQQVIAELKQDPNIAIVEPNYRRYPRSAHSTSDYPRNYARLNDLKLPQVWEIDKTIYRQQNKVKIAVIDDAFDIDHVDLKDNIVAPFDALNGGSDPRPQTCFKPETNIPQDDPPQKESHGTAVLGVVGAVISNDEGIDGAGDDALIVPIRISCNYTVEAEVKAFEYAIEQGVDIISISWGGPQYSEFERMSIVKMLKENILIITAAGNFDVDNDRVQDYPSGLDLPNIMSVAAHNEDGNLAYWSQYGQTTVDIAAPGTEVSTTTLNNNYLPKVEGTSFAAPFVAGVAASLLSRSSRQTHILDIKAAIMASATPFTDDLKARLVTDGNVDAFAAYSALNDPVPLPIIAKIEVDDSGITGNNNGEVDPGESVVLKVTIENIWEDANVITSVLLSEPMGGLIGREVITDLKGFDPESFQYNRSVLEFPVDFNGLYQDQNIGFELHLTSHYSADNTSVTAVRYFTVDTGSLVLGTQINNKMRLNDDNQDELHYYHVNVNDSHKNLSINLVTHDTANNLDLMVKYAGLPQFNYQTYTKSTNNDALDSGTKLGTIEDGTNNVTITNPEAGTYYIAVVASRSNSQPNIGYTISATATDGSESSGAGGCVMGKNHQIDPIFYFLLLVSFFRLSFFRNNKFKIA